MTGRGIIHSGANSRDRGWQHAAAGTVLATLALFVHVLVPVLFGPHMVRPRLASVEVSAHCIAGPSSQDPQRSRPKPQDCPICRHVASAAAAFVPALIAAEPASLVSALVPRSSDHQVRFADRSGIARPRAPPIG
ncbi:MAG: hypothetical protein P9C36_10815 [Defluviicoccus sp.]|nr:hypothetical protein [Defluviicoccus sp.]MDG4593102.1 hypothetical protein [Defluviicoccus sp.]MDS4009813.1 hypothetical protein [Defluviicoccus sp.]MDS4072584.1 hypothetical protein [Defluviicoccus sp.]